MRKIFNLEILKDLLCSVIAGVIVAFSLHVFSNPNGFAPGGISGISYILSKLLDVKMSYLLIIFNIPIFILVSIFVEKKLGIFLSIYVATQSIALILFEKYLPLRYVAAEGNLIFATIAMGVVSGMGFSLQIMRHGSSGGTYAISALIKRINPAANIAWMTFAMDSCVVILVLFFMGNTPQESIELAICTLSNLFLANIVVDYCMQGSKEGYKFEIITDEAESLSQEIMTELKHGVTELRVQGMYTHTERHMIVCIIRKRELGKMMKLLKKYPKSFANFAKVNEVFGKFKK